MEREEHERKALERAERLESRKDGLASGATGEFIQGWRGIHRESAAEGD